jgi:hypothetical protein
MNYDKVFEKMVLKIGETLDLRLHPLKVIIFDQVNIKTAFKFKGLENKLKGKLLF